MLAGAAIRHVNTAREECKGSGAAESLRNQSVSMPLLSASPQYPSKQFHIVLRLIDSLIERQFVEEVRSKERKRGQQGHERTAGTSGRTRGSGEERAMQRATRR